MHGLASSDFARHYSRNHYCFLFLWVLRCFTSPRSLPTPYFIQAQVTRHDSCWVTPFGNPRINASLPTPQGISQAGTSFIGSRCQGIHHVPLPTCQTNPQHNKQTHPSKEASQKSSCELKCMSCISRHKTLQSLRTITLQTTTLTQPNPRGPVGIQSLWSARVHYPRIKHQEAQPAPTQESLPDTRLMPQTPNSMPYINTMISSLSASTSEHPQPHRHIRSMSRGVLLRKEVIQPHLPVRLPCYDFVPIASPTFDGSPHKG